LTDLPESGSAFCLLVKQRPLMFIKRTIHTSVWIWVAHIRGKRLESQ